MVTELVPELQAHQLQELQKYLRQRDSQLSNDKLQQQRITVIRCKGSQPGRDGHQHGSQAHFLCLC